MNLKNLLSKFTFLFVLLLFLSSSAFGQTTYYVDVVNGLDGYDGLTPNVLGPGQGPKQTITNAIAAASSGDIISVAWANGNLYNENVVLGNKVLTFTSTGGAPNVVSFTVNNALGAPNNITTFTGPFTFTAGLTLQAGNVIGATNLTVGGQVTRTAGAVDGQLNFTGVVNFTYNGGAAVTSGGELPAAGNTANFGNLTTTGGGTALTLNESKTMNGLLTVSAGGMNLGGNTLTIVGANAGHTFGAAITNGTLAFTLTGAATITNNFNLPNITATKSTAGLALLTLATNQTIGNISASGNASVTAATAVTVGAVSNSGAGTITLGAATTIASITNTSSGIVTVTTAAAYNITNNVMQSGTGSITLLGGASANAIGIGGSVTNDPALTIGNNVRNAGNNLGVIVFDDRPVNITGGVSVGTTYSGTTGNNPTGWTNTGEVRFNATTQNVNITGALNVSTSHSIVSGGAFAATVSNNGGVIFAATTGTITITGGVNVSTNWSNIANTTDNNNGDVTAVARNNVAATITTGAMTNTSSGSNGANGNIIFGLAGAVNPGLTIGSISSTGGTGGYIMLHNSSANNESITVNGSVINSRTSNAAHIQFGFAPTAGVNIQIGGNLQSDGTSQTLFNGFNGAAGETFGVTGNLVVSGGTIAVDPTAALSGGGTFQFGGMDLSGGAVDLTGAGTTIMDVTVNGNTSFTGGALDVQGANALAVTNITTTPLVVPANNRVLQLGGLINNFSSANGVTNFSTNTQTLLLVQPTAVVAAQQVNGNATTTVWPGQIAINNPTGLQPAVTFAGGNFRALTGLAFHNSQVSINNVILFIGGQLAPNAGAGAFYNHSGYVTSGNGFVSQNSNANVAVGGAGTFGSFEVDVAGGNTATIQAGTGAFRATFNLTSGTTAGGANINFNNSTDFPTIVRNAGTFAVAPTFTSMVNVVYIGLDKATANELPAAANKLWNLTVATTNGTNVAGQGVVNVGVATTVNGTLNIFPNQALLLNGVDLTMNGESAVINGVLANVNAADEFVLARTAGTAVTGSGFLPDVRIAVGSSGNTINGPRALVLQYLGTDNLFGGAGAYAPGVNAGDFSPTANAATSSILFGAGTGELTVTFGNGVLGGTHFTNLTTAHANNTFTLGANATANGNFTHAAGTVDVATFTLTFTGTTHAYTAGANTIGDGMLQFTTGGATTLTVNTNTATIATNVGVDPSGGNFQLAAAGQNLIINGNLILNDVNNAAGGNFDIAPGRTLTAAGSNVTMTTGTAFIASGAGTGVLLLDIAAVGGTQTFTASAGAVAITNLTINDNVDLAFTGAAPTLTINGAYLHSGGNVGLGSHTLTVAGTGTFRRTAGTYTASTGFLVVNTTTFNQGATDFTVPNLNIGANIAATLAGQTGILTVTNALVLAQPGTADISSANTGGNTILAVDDGVTVTYNGVTATRFDVTVTYNGSITLIANPTANAVCHATIWPAAPADLVTTLQMNSGGGFNFEMPGDRNVGDLLDIRAGTLDLGTTANRTLTVTNSTMRRRGGAVALNGGSLVYTNPPDAIYEPAGGAAFNTGPELPAIVNTLTFTRVTNSANSVVTVTSAVTVNNELIFRNNVNTNVGAAITALGDVTIAVDAFTAATAPVFGFGAPLNFGGDAMQTITVPGGGAVLGAITINKTNNGDQVTIVGGNLTTGVITFVRGLLMTGNTTLRIPHPLLGGGQGFVRALPAGAVSHVVGNVAKGALVNTGAIATSSEPRIEFPVGSENVYRPVAITFNPNFGVPTIPAGVTLVVSHIDQSPTGTVGLPIINGVEQGVNVARYPGFYWNLSTLPTSISASVVFDLELGASAFADFDDINNVRIIRRHGTITDVTNQWLLQGLANNYDNEVNTGVPTIINRNSTAGLRFGGAVFTLGLRSRLSVANPIADQTLTAGGNAAVIDLSNPMVFAGNIGDLTYSAQSSNTGVATVAIDGSQLTVTPVAEGNAIISVTGTDTNNDFLTTQFNVNVAPLSNFTVSGTVTYDNADATPLAGVTVSLYVNGDMNSTPETATTDATGAYAITDLPNGTHVIQASSSAAWGGVNATDALLVSQHYAGTATLTGLRLSAGDVNNSSTVNNTDALKIVRRFAGLESSFTKPDWLFGATNVTVTGGDATADFKGIATGDVNGSYVPAGALPKTNIDLRSEEVMQVNPKDEFELPIKAASNMSLGAISLQFTYPVDQVELVEVKGVEGLVYNDVDGKVRVAWAALNGEEMNVKADNAVLVLKFKPTENFVAGNTFNLELVGENEISTFDGNVIEKAGLSAASVESFVPKAFALEQNYPNPFNPSTVIEYALPENAKVTLTVYNVLGQEVARVLDQEQEAGVYKVNWNASGLASGVYIYNIKVETPSKNYTDSKRMMLLK